jgi:hypothetical protein
LGRICTICSHEERHPINVALVRREPYRHIASHYGVSTAALQRHSREHIPKLLLEAFDGLVRRDAEDLAGELARVKEDVHRLKMKAEEDGDLRTALLGCDKALRALELQAKVEQLIQTAPQINILMTPEWVSLRTRLIYALDAYPEARGSVLRALESGGNGTA